MSGWTRRDLLTLGIARAPAPATPAPRRAPERGWVARLEPGGATPPAPQARTSPRRVRGGRALPLHRPPGSIREEEFLAGCTRCLDCASACPHGAIVAGDARLGAAAGTPVISAAAAPCYLCSDRPCASACAAGVIEAQGAARMGAARVLDHSCLAVRGVGCSACHEQCPVPGAMRWEEARPVVDLTLCTGCGVCLYVCPAPQKAILLTPLPARGVA